MLQGEEVEAIRDNLLDTANILIIESNRINEAIATLNEEEERYYSLLGELETNLQGVAQQIYEEIQRSQELGEETETVNQQYLEVLYQVGYAQGAVDLSSELGKQSKAILEQIIEGRIEERKARKKAFFNELVGTVITVISVVSAVITAGAALGALAAGEAFLVPALSKTLNAVTSALSAVQAAYNGDWSGAIFNAGMAALGFAGQPDLQRVASGIYHGTKAVESGDGITAFLQFTKVALPDVLPEYSYLSDVGLAVHNGVQAAEEDEWFSAFSSFLSAGITLGTEVSKSQISSGDTTPLISPDLLNVLNIAETALNLGLGIATVIEEDSLEGWLSGIQQIANAVTGYVENKQPIDDLDKAILTQEAKSFRSVKVQGKSITLRSIGEVDPTKPTQVIVHGWIESAQGWSNDLGELLKEKYPGHNIVVVDWNEFSRNLWYPSAAQDTIVVGQKISQALHGLGVNLEDTTIIGYSLGAQVAANIAEYGQSQYGQKVDQIVALDAAKPGFEQKSVLGWVFDSVNPVNILANAFGVELNLAASVEEFINDLFNISSTKNQLDSGDAKSVIALHTDYKGLFPLGVGGDVGTVDLYFTDEALNNYKYPLDHQDSKEAFFEYIQYGNGKTYQEFFASEVNNKQVDPIILDLNNDGIQLIPLNESPVTFDLDNDGEPEPTGWSSPEDGFLAHDRNQDGKINNITELFSEYYSPNAETGLDALATLDSNKDNIIDSNDPEYANLSLWQDRNLNGTTDPAELTPLPETDITNLHLNSTPVLQNLEGNLLLSTTEFTRSDGTLGEAAEVAFLIDNRDPLTGIPQNQQLVGNPPTLDTPDLEILPTDSLPLTYTHGNPVDINPLPELITSQPDIFADTTL